MSYITSHQLDSPNVSLRRMVLPVQLDYGRESMVIFACISGSNLTHFTQMATQVCMRSANYDQIWDLILNHGVTHYCGAPTVQLSILNHPLARQPSQPVRTSIAGAAPTASLIEGLEAIGITVNHGAFAILASSLAMLTH